MKNLAVKPQSRLYSFALSREDANLLVHHWHRTHEPLKSHRFSIGVMDEDGRVCGAAICGNGRGRSTKGDVVEVSRVVSDGTPNACSFLLAACADAAQAMGFTRIQTYTSGGNEASLRALKSSGWIRNTKVGFIHENTTFVRKSLWYKDLNLTRPTPNMEPIMPRITEKELHLMQVRIFEEDFIRMQKYCVGSMTPNAFIRSALQSVLNQLDAQTDAEINRARI